MGSVRPHDGPARRRERRNLGGDDSIGVGTGAVAVLLWATAAAPFLNGILAGFALVGAAVVVRDVLGV